MRTMNLWKNRLYMKPVLTKEWQTDKLTYQADIAKAQSAQRDKGIKTYHTMHVNTPPQTEHQKPKSIWFV